MEVLVTKTSLELDKQSSSRDSGVKCLLYEARNSLNGQQPAANYWNSWESLTLKWLYHKLWLQELSQQQLSWQNLEKVLKDPLPFTNYPWMKITFKVFCDISSVNRSDSGNHVNDSQLTAFPRFPLMLHINNFKYQLSGRVAGREQRHQHNISHAILFES